MKHILGILFVLLAITGWAVARDTAADDVHDVDDVYYWESHTPSPVTRHPSPVTDTSPVTDNTSPVTDNPSIFFLEDSVTLNSDTIVKAIIRR